MLLIFQTISFTYENIGHIYAYDFKSRELLSRSIKLIDVTPINRDDIRRSFFQIKEEQIENSSLEHIYFVYNSENNSLYDATLTDSYEDISLMNPHYFHGSKYKE